MRASHHLAAVAIAVLVGGSSALAQSAPPPAPAAAVQPSQPLSIDTPIEVLVSIPSAKAVLDTDMPGLIQHPMYDKFKGESIRTLAPKFGGAISNKDVAKLQVDLAALSLTLASR